MKTLKKVGGIALDILIVLVFIISAVLVVANITVDKENGGQANVFGYVINSVQTESMSGTFEKHALVVGKLVDENTVIEEGTIITYKDRTLGKDVQNTHRVIRIETVGNEKLYYTKGDNPEIKIPDPEPKTMYDVVAVYKFHIPLLGGFIDFLKEPIGFVICLVLPMLAFIAWQVYKLISIYLQSKKEQLLAEASENVSEEAKDAIIREYLAKMQAESEEKPKEEEPVAAPSVNEVSKENNVESDDNNT